MIRRFARFTVDDRTSYAELFDGGKAHPLDAAPWHGGKPTGQIVDGVDGQDWRRVQARVPVEPAKILCVGRNYRAHARELGNELPSEPLLFLKPSSALLEHGGELQLPPENISQRVEHEAELGVVVGERLKHASVEQAAAAIFGYTIVADVTARDLQRRDKQWTRAKGMDGFCPAGPLVVSGIDAAALSIRCWVGDELRQDGNTRAMVFPPAQVLSYASQVMTLEPGDLIATGTPAGVGPLTAGDELRIAIENIGELSVHVTGGTLS